MLFHMHLFASFYNAYIFFVDTFYFICILYFYIPISALISLAAPQFRLVLDTIIWAFKHTMRNVADTGLDILHSMLLNIQAHPTQAQTFYQTYYIMILRYIFLVVTDTSHTAGNVQDFRLP